jgi:hypothetical protein
VFEEQPPRITLMYLSVQQTSGLQPSSYFALCPMIEVRLVDGTATDLM